MEMFKSILFGDPGEDEEDNATLPLILRDDTVIPFHSSAFDPDDEEQDSDTSYADEYSGGDDSDSDAADLRDTTRTWIEHIVKVTRDLYAYEKEELDMIETVYKLFYNEYAQEDLNLGALEYIRDPVEYNHVANQTGTFRTLFYANLTLRHEPCKGLDGVEGVFIVNKRLDFIYGRVIECALLNGDERLSREAFDAFKRRKEETSPCVEDHVQSEKFCPCDWVLYANTGSQFYAYCSRLLKRETPYIDFGITAQYVNAERLSFYLVLFLCGHLMPTGYATDANNAEYVAINQWKKLPVWFLPLWYAGNPPK